MNVGFAYLLRVVDSDTDDRQESVGLIGIGPELECAFERGEA